MYKRQHTHTHTHTHIHTHTHTHAHTHTHTYTRKHTHLFAAVSLMSFFFLSDVNWGSSGQAHAYNDALKTTLKLVDVNEHVKNFR